MSKNHVELSFGMKGSGKSFLIKRELDALPRHAPLYVWDFNREYAGPSAKDPIRDARVFTSWDAFVLAAKSQQGHLGRVVLQVERQRFVPFVRFCYLSGGCTVVLDELHAFATKSKAHEEALEDLLYTSRHRRINVKVASWRPTELPPFVRHCYDELRGFQTSEVNDLKWYKETTGFPDAVALVRSLPKHAYMSHVRGAVPRVVQPKKPKAGRT